MRSFQRVGATIRFSVGATELCPGRVKVAIWRGVINLVAHGPVLGGVNTINKLTRDRKRVGGYLTKDQFLIASGGDRLGLDYT